MKEFGGTAFFIKRDDINTDEIIPAKYLTEISKQALKPHLLEDLRLEDGSFTPDCEELKNATVLVTGSNFGCGSSREHAVWALEVNDINVVIGESFARIFRQNMFNCGILAIEQSREEIEKLFDLTPVVTIVVDIKSEQLTATDSNGKQVLSSFSLNNFDRELVESGGWLTYADSKY
jgi:3-isopropylmalate/(R)-2-methylmalate dehydratase small subunit